MWTCPYCGGKMGQPFEDGQLQGMLCLAPDCGRFDSGDNAQQPLINEWDASDL
ncbi:hypothetical protein GCM10023228_01120 [Brevibacillus fulvus]